MKKEIIIVSVNSPENEGRLKKTLELLSGQFKITLLCPLSNYNCNNINCIPIGDKRPVGITEQLFFIFKVVKKLKIIDRSKKYDAVYVANVLSVPGALLIQKKLKIKKIIYDAYEIFFTMKDTQIGLKNKVYLYFEKIIIGKSDLIIEANYERALLAQGYYQLSNLPIVVTNFNYYNNSYLPLKVKNVNSSIIRLGYVGYVSKERLLMNVIEEVCKCSNIEFHIYGNGSDVESIKDFIILHNYANIKYHGEYKIKDLENILSSIDIGYINYPVTNYNNIYCEPNKIYEYCANNTPMVSYCHPKLDKLFKEHGIGSSKTSIIEAIREITGSYDKFIDACKYYYSFQLSLAKIENEKYLNAIKNIL